MIYRRIKGARVSKKSTSTFWISALTQNLPSNLLGVCFGSLL